MDDEDEGSGVDKSEISGFSLGCLESVGASVITSHVDDIDRCVDRCLFMV